MESSIYNIRKQAEFQTPQHFMLYVVIALQNFIEKRVVWCIKVVETWGKLVKLSVILSLLSEFSFMLLYNFRSLLKYISASWTLYWNAEERINKSVLPTSFSN